MEQKLKLYKYDNGELVSFPSKESQIEIGVFTYTAKRMVDAPTITATINYKECLDNLWTGKECVIFNDEFFYVKNIPTSSYSNTDSRYKHECTFVNERSKLNGVLFTDVVDDKASDGKPVSNSSKFSFNGNITEFVARLNASLRYAKLQTIENSLVYGYHVVIDEGTKAIENFNDTFNVSFEDKTISEAIQEIYNSYNIPYYFEGKTVHVGLIDEEHDLLSDIDGGFKYGVNNELISISKSNKNNKIINRITALGSSENIPYYYPNETEKGSVAVTEYGKDTIPSYVELFNPFLFAKKVGKDDKNKDDKIHYLKGNASWSTGVTIYEGDDSLDFKSVSFDESVKVKCKREDGSVHPVSNIKICFSIHVKDREDYFTIKPYIAIDNSAFGGGYEYSFNKDLVLESYLSNERGRIDLVAGDEKFNPVEIPVGTYQLWITYKVSHRYAKKTAVSSFIDKNVKVKLEVFNSYEKFWFLNDSTTRYNLEDFGLRLTGGVSPYNGMAFAQKVTIPYYPISQNLILPIYRSTQGEERFYNAYNATYKDENGNYYDFKNEYAEDSISEHIVKFDDIKPTIKGVEYNGRRIDKFVEFAYDKSDNDIKQVVEDKEEYQHPYFFAKLPPLGFNLFDHALETGEMTISMTSGHCAGCSFTIMVNDANKNTVQVDEDGNLKYDEGGYVLVGSVNGQGNQSPIDSQNDTTNNSVWIALKKDIDSFGTILPSSNIKPSSNDTFVITNILLPQEYIEAAEERLKNEAIKYMAENNSSKFSFSIKFSRIFLAENPTIFDKISENSRIAVNYNGSIYPLHVSSYSYKMSEGALLPEIDVSLTDSVVIATNAIESAVSEAKADVLTYVDRYATLEEATTIFIRKDKEDYSPSPMVYGRSLTVNESHKVGENLDVAKNATIGEKTTTKAIQVGEQASVGNYVEGVSGIVMKIDSDGSSYMELDRLKVRMKAYFDELEVQKVNTVGGKMIMSPAGSFTCGAVLTSEELLANGEDVDTTNGSFYRCFFNAVQDDEQIENKFIVGDFAFSQSFNLTGRSSNKMYWREVVGVSSTYVDLSYDKCALDSDIPSSGDVICQLGSKVKDRQNAIVMAAVGDYAPSITLHYGIDKFSLSGTEIIQYGVRDGKAFFNSYGDMFLGEKPVEGVSNAYMKYTTEGGLEIKGKFIVKGEEELDDVLNFIEEDYKEYADNTILNARFSKYNMIRNSGFTGDYLSSQVEGNMSVDKKELFSDPYLHWICDKATIEFSADSISGYEMHIASGGSIMQKLQKTPYYSQVVKKGKEYTISFKAKGGTLSIGTQGGSQEFALGDEMMDYVYHFTASQDGYNFAVSAKTDVVICELQLSSGNAVTEWGMSILDNQSELANYETLAYLSKSLQQGKTEITGGLLLSDVVMCGDSTELPEGEERLITSGISGLYNDEDSVAFWAGGNMLQATRLVTLLKDNPNYQPTEAEWANLAKFVVTHGGESFMRGYVYALGGMFRGTVYANVLNAKAVYTSFNDFYISSSSEDVTLNPKEDGTKIKIIVDDGTTPILLLPYAEEYDGMELTLYVPYSPTRTQPTCYIYYYYGLTWNSMGTINDDKYKYLLPTGITQILSVEGKWHIINVNENYLEKV